MKKTKYGFVYKKLKRNYYRSAVRYASLFFNFKLKKMKKISFRVLCNMYLYDYISSSVLDRSSYIVGGNYENS